MNNFCFLVDFITPTGPMVTMVTRYTGGLPKLLLVKIRCEKSMIEDNSCFLVLVNNNMFLSKMRPSLG